MNCLDESNPLTQPPKPAASKERDDVRLCVDCGDPISARILERRPTARRCSTCCIRAMFGP